MTAKVVATAYGGPEVLALVADEARTPGPGEVVVDVRAAGVNPVDYKLYSGARGNDPSLLPMPVGMEAAGVVLAVGGDAAGPLGPVREGDEVIAFPVRGGGAYAGQVVVLATSVLPKPAQLSWEAASGLMLAGVTAVHELEVTGVSAGDTVLVHGAAGGVGLMTVQLAVERGATVIATAAEPSHERLRSLGAEPITYGPGLIDRVRQLAPGGVDVAIDNVGTDEAVDVSLELVADRSRIVTIAGFERAAETGIHLIGNRPGADPGTEIRAQARLTLLDLVEKGRLQVFVERTYPLADAASAHRYLQAGHTHGKVALLP